MSQTETNEKQYHQYFSARPTITITMPSAKRIRFVGGVYLTNREDEIGFLDNEVAQDHPMIFVKKGQETVSSDAFDPLAAIKKKAIEEYLAQVDRVNDPDRDMGTTVQYKTAAVQTTKSIAAITVGSKSTK